MKLKNYLSIDVEDYFQVSAFETVFPPQRWTEIPCRVADNTERILDLLDMVEAKGTFFVLGWVARRFPHLVREIVGRGHELASHGFYHRRVTTQSRRAFRLDIRSSKSLLEDLGGVAVLGYRAPSYSISKDTLWAYDELLAAGFLYDSSVFPVRHDYYGISDWPSRPFSLRRFAPGCWIPAVGDEYTGRLFEVPLTTVRLAGQNLPVAGGGYFRLYPYAVTRWICQRINQVEKRPFVFYIHPWELDPDQPRVPGVPMKSRFRHTVNLDRTLGRFQRLLRDFAFAPIRELFPADPRTSRRDVRHSAGMPSSGFPETAPGVESIARH